MGKKSKMKKRQTRNVHMNYVNPFIPTHEKQKDYLPNNASADQNAQKSYTVSIY